MMDLSTATIEQIKAELARRERVANLPHPVPRPEPNTDVIVMLVHRYIHNVSIGADVSDFKQYFFEEAVTAVYGPSIWSWVRAKQE